MVLIREQNFAIAIYVTEKDGLFFLRYEILDSSLTAETIAAIESRMKKSFALDGKTPDARTERGIELKANLMRTIFKTEFGLAASIIYEFTRTT